MHSVLKQSEQKRTVFNPARSSLLIARNFGTRTKRKARIKRNERSFDRAFPQREQVASGDSSNKVSNLGKPSFYESFGHTNGGSAAKTRTQQNTPRRLLGKADDGEDEGEQKEQHSQ